jgi:hypothetical protein
VLPLAHIMYGIVSLEPITSPRLYKGERLLAESFCMMEDLTFPCGGPLAHGVETFYLDSLELVLQGPIAI